MGRSRPMFYFNKYLILMKTSFYNLIFKIDNKSILFNTLTGNLIEVEVEMKNALELGNLKEIPDDISSQLFQMGFLQDEESDQTGKRFFFR